MSTSSEDQRCIFVQFLRTITTTQDHEKLAAAMPDRIYINSVIEFHFFFVLIAFFSKAAKNNLIDFFYIFTSISRAIKHFFRTLLFCTTDIADPKALHSP